MEIKNPWRLALFLFGFQLFPLPQEAVAQVARAGRLQVRVLDEKTGRPTPVRVRLTRPDGMVAPLPDAAVAVMYGLWDHADGYGFQPDSSFYVAGTFAVDLPPGTYSLSLSKGNEYLAQQQTVQVRPGRTLRKSYRLSRWIDMPARGWYSGDDHIHIRRSPREDPHLLHWTQAEDIHVGVMLRMGDFWETYYPQYAWGEKGVFQIGNYLLTSGQEDPRTPELGHTIGVGASDRVRFRNEYYLYDKVFDRLHELGGLTGYAHQAESFHGYRGLTLDGLRGKVDMLEILQFCVSGNPLLTDHYYHLLDLGYAVTAMAGSDFPWCGKDHDHGRPERSARIGNVRFYTYTGGPLSYASWKAGLAAGRTFVSTGPVLDFRVNDKLPGERLDVPPGTTVQLTARAYGHPDQMPLQALELVGHGRVLGRVTASDPGQSGAELNLALELPVEQGLWLAARCFGPSTQAAHTTPVYVTVAGGGFHNPATVPHYLALSEKYLQELEAELQHPDPNPEKQAWRYREGLHQRIAETREVIEQLKGKLK
ncbi:hypothetical protein BH24BAC1_BH24BAC1_36320 [soil metagenome]